MANDDQGLYIALISVHGLIRSENLELGRDSDTGGQTLYVVELARALARHPKVAKIDLFTRRIFDKNINDIYNDQIEILCENAQIIRIAAGPQEYIPKEQLWDHLDTFADNVADYLRSKPKMPHIIHSHYADAGYVGSRLANFLGIPLIHTGHSLGRVKRRRLLASGISTEDIEKSYHISRRIEAEEFTLATAERVITSTNQEIEEQYELYDHYQPEQMQVIPPGTDVEKFLPPDGNELQDPLFNDISRFLKEPNKPIIFSISRPDKRKNITGLIEAYGQSETLKSIANLVIIAGNRDDIDELDDAAQEVLHQILVAIDRFDLYGKIAIPKHHSRDQVPLLYRMAAASKGVFVNPALTEPFGLTLIEAAASGLPIIATDDGGPNDIIGNCKNGILIDPFDSDTITSALEKLLTDYAYWQQCAKSGFDLVKKFYSWDAHANRYIQLIQPIAERRELITRKPIQKRLNIFRERAIISDLDQNLLGDTSALQELISVIKKHRKTTKFAIATGRRLDSAVKIMKKNKIPEPDILITSCGTEIYYAPKLTMDTAWKNHIEYHWTPYKVRRVMSEISGLLLQAKSEQSKFKVSYYYDEKNAPDFETINSLLHQEELSVNLNIAFGQFIDVIPIRASKGLALRYIADRWQIPLKRIFVAGGSGADEDMMRGNTLAAVVANRHHEELSQLEDNERIYFADKPFAAGILEALEFYDFFNT